VIEMFQENARRPADLYGTEVSAVGHFAAPEWSICWYICNGGGTASHARPHGQAAPGSGARPRELRPTASYKGARDKRARAPWPRSPAISTPFAGRPADRPPALGGTVPIVGTKAGRHAARERVSAYHQAQLAELLTHVTTAIDHYRAGEIDAHTVDETIHHYHRAAGELWKFCWASGSSTHLELIARLIDEQTANGETTDWWQDGAPRTR
jgi:hypothetical protein